MSDPSATSAIIGLIPAAGRGNRIAPLPCSKEILPVGFRRDDVTGEPRVMVASHHLFDKLRHAGITRALIVLRNGKWDIPAYLGDGAMVGMSLAYLVIEGSEGPPDTLDRAFPFVDGSAVAFAFPDILFGPDDVFARLREDLADPDVDAVLGLYPAHDCRVMDMVDLDQQGRVRSLILKPQTTELTYTWLCAIWRPRFTGFMHEFVAAERAAPGRARRRADAQGDLPVGAVIAAALGEGLRIVGRVFAGQTYIDIGTPSALVQAVTAPAAGR
jgi:glucose-1-phosphate thymidylyltransferase